jgi:hypothetical protein
MRHAQVSTGFNRAVSTSSAEPQADDEKLNTLQKRTSSSPEFWGPTRRLVPRLEVLRSEGLEDLAATRRSLSRQRGFRRSSAYNVDPEGGLDDSAESPVIIHPLKARSSSPSVLRTRLPNFASSGSAKDVMSPGYASGDDPPHVACPGRNVHFQAADEEAT